MNKLILTVGNLGRFLGTLVTGLWDGIKGIVTHVWTAVVFFVTMITSAVWGLTQGLEELSFNNYHNLTFVSGAVPYISFANKWLPLSETFAFLVTYFGLIIGVTVYRFLKSWIPTLSS